ncbi:E3 ubiquitin-protein ligase TRIM21-like [Eucyclogobius newberryi]|uniref:E3 ubiquitin-protein ligase TRIM21-like n=1 Tax=Eucyclogobius newberryi TaxID=166745 RepID=UPI003B5C0AC1
MALSLPSPAAVNAWKMQLSCSICIETFKDPVTTICGHSFCKECLTRSLRLHNPSCPLCKNFLLNRPPDVNIVLRNVVDQMKRDEEERRKVEEAAERESESEKRREEERRRREEEECDPRRFRGRPGQVPCDVCPEMAATKSCLICLASYCDEHLRKHAANRRFKGHKMVNPVENLDQRACLTHGRPLELYSRRQGKCICVLCMGEGEEGVVSTEDEWDSKKAKLERTVEELKESIAERKTKMDEINAALKECKELLDGEWRDINNVFSATLAMLECAQARALKPVKERRRRLSQEAAELVDALQMEVDALEKTINELEEIAAFEDHVLFLQKYPSLKEPGVNDWADVELDTFVRFGSLRKVTTEAMEQLREQLEKLTALELRRLTKYSVDVTLDPTTSHRRLILSEDKKEVVDGEKDQEAADDSERFDTFGSVLGREGLDVGSRVYWEVQVAGKSGWDLGVASANANRKGKLTLSPDRGYWAIVHYEGDKYAALTAPPACVELKHKPQRVGVFLDYDEGLLSFYNVTDEAHIYSFSKADFAGEILPYFSPHVKNETNTAALIISNVQI